MSSAPFHPNIIKMEEGEQLPHDSLFPFTYNTSDYQSDIYQSPPPIYNRKRMQIPRPPDDINKKRTISGNNSVHAQYCQKTVQSENGSDNSSIGTTTSTTHTNKMSPYSSNISTDPRSNWHIAKSNTVVEHNRENIGSPERSLSDDQHTHLSASEDNETEQNEEDSTDISNSVEVPSPEISYAPTHKTEGNEDTSDPIGGSDRKKEGSNPKLPLPLANIFRIMKRALPKNAKVTKESKDKIQESVLEFIEVITIEAIRHCSNDKRKTINGDDILLAMKEKGLQSYINYLSRFLDRLRKDKKPTSSSQYVVPGSINSMNDFTENYHSVNRLTATHDGYTPLNQVINSLSHTSQNPYPTNSRGYNYQEIPVSHYSVNMNDYLRTLYKPELNNTQSNNYNYTQALGSYPSNMNSSRMHMPEKPHTQIPINASKVHLNMSNILAPNFHTQEVSNHNPQEQQPSTHNRNQSFQPSNRALYVNNQPYNISAKPNYNNPHTVPPNIYVPGNAHRMNELLFNNINNTHTDINNIHNPRQS